jgi:hypothetical protein
LHLGHSLGDSTEQGAEPGLSLVSAHLNYTSTMWPPSWPGNLASQVSSDESIYLLYGQTKHSEVTLYGHMAYPGPEVRLERDLDR